MRKKASKLLAVLALAGFCGTTQSQARSHRIQNRNLEKQRNEQLQEHLEARERLNELEEIRNFDWDVKSSELAREREAEAARVRETTRTIAKIDKAIRKEKAVEGVL